MPQQVGGVWQGFVESGLNEAGAFVCSPLAYAITGHRPRDRRVLLR